MGSSSRVPGVSDQHLHVHTSTGDLLLLSGRWAGGARGCVHPGLLTRCPLPLGPCALLFPVSTWCPEGTCRTALRPSLALGNLLGAADARLLTFSRALPDEPSARPSPPLAMWPPRAPSATSWSQGEEWLLACVACPCFCHDSDTILQFSTSSAERSSRSLRNHLCSSFL